MSKTLTLARVITRFLETHPNYKPNLADIHQCMYFISCNFMPLYWSTDGEIPRLQLIIEMQNREIAQLKDMITALNKRV